MRVLFSSMSRPKRVSKFHVDATGLPIAHAQNEVAYVLGYKDWHELQRVTNSNGAQRSLDDETLSDTELAKRRAYQVSRLLAYRRGAGRTPITLADAERVIDLVRPSALIRLPRTDQAKSPDSSTQLPEALLDLLRNAEVRGAHKIQIRDIRDTTTVQYRTNFHFSQEEPIEMENAKALFDWISTNGDHSVAHAVSARVRTVSRLGNSRLDLEITSIWVVGGRIAGITIRQVDKVASLDMLGFTSAQSRTLQSRLDGPGICIVSGVNNHGRHTTARALVALRPDVPYLGELKSANALPPLGIATVHAKSAIFALERLTLPHFGSARMDLAASDAISVVSHQHLLPVLCQHCSIPATRALSTEKCDRIKSLFGISLLAARVTNPEGCNICHFGDQASRRLTVVAETLLLEGAVRDEFARDGDVESAFRSLRTSPFDSPETRGKIAIEVAMYGVSRGLFDINDVERHIEYLDDYSPCDGSQTT